MRPIETIVTVAGIATSLGWALLHHEPRLKWTLYASGCLLALACAADVMVVGWRWPMLPAYAATIALVIVATFTVGAPPRAAWTGACATACLFLVSLAACAILPARPSTAVPGPFGVGTAPLELNTKAHTEWSDGAPDHAAPLADLWYPTERMANSGSAQSPLSIAAIGAWLAGPGRDPVQRGTPPARVPSRFPVVLYFSGWDGTGIDNSIAIHDLASHGFVVVTLRYPARLTGESDTAYSRRAAELKRPMDFSSDRAFHESMLRADARVHARARDAQIVVDTLARVDSEDPRTAFAHRLDLERIGIFGFSFGGAVAVQATWLDRRFKAAANLDGWHFGESAKQGIDRPYLFISDDTPPAALANRGNPVTRATAFLDDQDYRQSMANLRRHGGIFVVVAGATHVNYSDAALRSPLRRLTGAGRIAALRAQYIVASCLIEFFGKYLAARDSELLSTNAARFPEVRMQIWRPAQAGSLTEARP